jgi:hypothetical protein
MLFRRLTHILMLALAAVGCSMLAVSCKTSSSPTSVATDTTQTPTTANHHTISFTFKGTNVACTNATVQRGHDVGWDYLDITASQGNASFHLRLWNPTATGEYVLGQNTTYHWADLTIDWMNGNVLTIYQSAPGGIYGLPNPCGTVQVSSIDVDYQTSKGTLQASLLNTYQENDQPVISNCSFDVSP